MIKFGGSGRNKQACQKRRYNLLTSLYLVCNSLMQNKFCSMQKFPIIWSMLSDLIKTSNPFFFFLFSRCPNMAVKEAEDDENIEEEDIAPLFKSTTKMSQAKKKQTKNKVTWVGEPIMVGTC